MHRSTPWTLSVLLVFVAACSSAPPDPEDEAARDAAVSADAHADEAGARDGGTGAVDATNDAGELADASDAATEAADPNACEWGGAPGECMSVSACAAEADRSSYAGECPGPTSIECCIVTPNTADNPPVPAGYELMEQSQVTAAMTTWAVDILDDPKTYPMFSTTTMTFGSQLVLARVEWHPPDFQNSVIHRGVTLYVPV